MHISFLGLFSFISVVHLDGRIGYYSSYTVSSCLIKQLVRSYLIHRVYEDGTELGFFYLLDYV